MPSISDHRIVELKVLENLADRIWDSGVCMVDAVGQAATLGIGGKLYADLVLTLIEDGYLRTENLEIKRDLAGYSRDRIIAYRDSALSHLWASTIYHQMEITYRGYRRINELRDQLRHDRILESFGILLDGRYIVSDSIHFLERTNGESLSLILADVDDFKRFNSDHGYKAGDAVLRQVFRIFKRTVSARGEVYRRGGEEIVVLLPYSKLDEGRSVAESIREEVEKTTVPYEGENLHVTLSVGVAASPPCNPDGPTLESYAENGLKQAKSSGKNRVVVSAC